MENFNRNNRSSGRNFKRSNFSSERRSFNNRDSDRPSIMHKATCSRCGRDCEVPFRPTGERPIFCSSCFENNRDSERSSNFSEREMFNAVCDECGNNCQVPFHPSSGKPIYCSNCFESKKEQPQIKGQIEQLNNKLDKILALLTPNNSVQPIQENLQEEPAPKQPEVQAVDTEKVVKVAKKRASKKKE